ncbi:MAG: DUF6314 family protein [Planctomycetota bacterium]
MQPRTQRTSPPTLPAQIAQLGDLTWHRTARDHRAAATAELQGTATITTGSPLTVHEQGHHNTGTLAPQGTPVRQTWSLKPTTNAYALRITTITVDLKPGTHQTWHGETTCGPDRYHARLSIDANARALRVVWIVEGPKKHYRLDTTYTPA